jgi:UDP-N-acetylglucosamine 1-carboxyvinyltransferase
MDKFRIEGGRPLEGRVVIGGAKNAALPAMAAALLTPKRVVLRNMPRVRDILTMRTLLDEMGTDSSLKGESDGNRLTLQARRIVDQTAPYELVKQMRASVLVLGPLVARFGRARVSLPGGCAIGARPINLHLKGLEKLGAKITMDHGYVDARAERLRGDLFHFDTITVTGTENLMMAATLADGETVLENAAIEPEVQDLGELLNKMGAEIQGLGTSTIRIKGVSELHGAEHRIIPDRIETGTFLVAAAITGGHLTLERVEPAHVTAVVAKLTEVGVKIDPSTLQSGGNRVCRLEVCAPGLLRASDVTTREYPGFPTDMQAQYMALATQSSGASVITETIFENRYLHALELARMGADVTVDGRRAVVRGPAKLSGASLQASDLRASASLVLAALAAEGESVIDRVYHIDRGYERIEEKLRRAGAIIERISEEG